MRLIRFPSNPALIMIAGDEGSYIMPAHLPTVPQPFFVAADDANGAKRLNGILARYPKLKIRLLLNHRGQDYKTEILPRLNPFDRSKLIGRRLQSAFADADLRVFCKNRNQRRHILGVGVSLADLKPLLGQIAHHHVTMALLPLECAGLLEKLCADSQSDWQFLLAPMQSGGFRQIVTYKGELALTRIIPFLPDPDSASAAVARNIMQHLKASLDYLGRHGLSGDRQPEIIIFAPPGLHPALRGEALPGVTLRIFTPCDAAQKLGLTIAMADDALYCDGLFAAWALRQNYLRLPLRTMAQRRALQNRRIDGWGRCAAVIAVICLLVVITGQVADLASKSAELYQAARQLAKLQAGQSAKRAAIPPSNEALGRLRLALERRYLFTAPQPAPWPLLDSINQGIGGTARLVKLDWQSGGDSPRSGKPVGEILHVDMQLADPALRISSNRRQIVDAFQALAKAVADRAKNYDVAITRYPFPALPYEILSSDSSAKIDDARQQIAEISFHKKPDRAGP